MEQGKTVGECVDELMFTEKDFHCIASHIAQLQQFEWGNFDNSYACEICAYHGSCGVEKDMGNNIKSRMLDCWEAFVKLGKLSGVELTPMQYCGNSIRRKIQWLEERIAALEV